MPASVKVAGRPYKTLYARRRAGWSDREIVYGKANAATIAAERQWRDLLPEPYWPQWEWFEQNTDGNQPSPSPATSRRRTRVHPELMQGPRGRALRLLCKARAVLTDLNEKLYEQHFLHVEYGGPPPDERLSREHDFSTELHARARSVLMGR